MSRAPNIAISQWFRQNGISLQNWVEQAQCARHLDLPWMVDTQPERPMLIAMSAVCASCPVLKRCAVEALNAGPAGGFYAGVWVPWLSMSEDTRSYRAFARRRLKDVAGIPRVGRPSGPRKPYQ